MADSTIQSLLGAVRRRMWRSEFVTGARLALGGTAGLILVAVAVHLSVQPVRLGALLSAIAVLWAAVLARAGVRRPSDFACALWADRHLGGASAFSTLLEKRNGAQAVPDAGGLRWLEHWARARVPHSLRLLEERRDPARLSRPLLSVLVCAAFATLVLTLPGLSPSPRQRLPASAATSLERQAPQAESTVTEDLAGELTHALRSAESHNASDGREVGPASAVGPGHSDDTTATTLAQSAPPAPAERATTGKPPGAAPGDGAPATGATGASGAGPGRAAGDRPDERVDAGSSRVLRGTMPLQRRESRARRPPEMQADMDQAATFDEDTPMRLTAQARSDPAPPATPPAATEATRLTPTLAAYVQAWMRANGQRR